MKAIDMTGQQFGYWTVLYKDKPHHGSKNSFWVCRCKCGNTGIVTRSCLLSGRSSSCGCKPNENRKGINRTHGMSKTRLYHEWASMRKRCRNPNDRFAKSYYLKGITVCNEWNSFEAFRDWSLSNGYDDSLTIDRIDNSKGYCPENCRWIPNSEQSSNRTNNRFIEYNGQMWCLRTLSEHLGFPYKTAHRRYMRLLRAGKPITSEKLFEPIHTEKIPIKLRH